MKVREKKILKQNSDYQRRTNPNLIDGLVYKQWIERCLCFLKSMKGKSRRRKRQSSQEMNHKANLEKRKSVRREKARDLHWMGKDEVKINTKFTFKFDLE